MRRRKNRGTWKINRELRSKEKKKKKDNTKEERRKKEKNF